MPTVCNPCRPETYPKSFCFKPRDPPNIFFNVGDMFMSGGKPGLPKGPPSSIFKRHFLNIKFFEVSCFFEVIEFSVAVEISVKIKIWIFVLIGVLTKASFYQWFPGGVCVCLFVKSGFIVDFLHKVFLQHFQIIKAFAFGTRGLKPATSAFSLPICKKVENLLPPSTFEFPWKKCR